MASHLLLIVTSHTCTCGNRWTSSYSVLSDEKASFLGGTPLPAEAKLPYSGYLNEQKSTVSACFRCLPLALGIGWTRLPLTATVSPKPLTDPDDLLTL